MIAQFDIAVEPARDLVRITLSGFFTPDDLDAFLATRDMAFARLGCPVTEHLALTDVRDMRIQSQEMVAAFGTLLADPRTRSRRLAFVVASTLARQQLGRAIGRRDARCFTDIGTAEAWLLSDDPAAQAA